MFELFFSKRRRKLGHGAFDKIWPWEFSYFYENLQMSNVLSNIFDLLISGKYESTCTYSSPAGHSSQQDQLTLQPPKPMTGPILKWTMQNAHRATEHFFNSLQLVLVSISVVMNLLFAFLQSLVPCM